LPGLGHSTVKHYTRIDVGKDRPDFYYMTIVYIKPTCGGGTSHGREFYGDEKPPSSSIELLSPTIAFCCRVSQVYRRSSLALVSLYSRRKQLDMHMSRVSRQGAKAARHFRRLELRQAPARQKQQPTILFDTIRHTQ
jgi:hypothetical protein